jgi:NADH-quinone oxidoreductase subunit L
MVYAIGAGGIFASQFHLLSHSVFKALLFLGAGAVIHSAGTRDMREMGGLSRTMPFTCAVFILGAVALAGIPPLNGFWSKEMVLEAGQAHGLPWAYPIMVATAGLTSLYAARCLWMVFFRKPSSERHAHEAGPAMIVALVPLALGTLISWLLASPFRTLLARTLPFHFDPAAQVPSTGDMVREILSAPSTLVALGVIALGIAAWAAWGIRSRAPGRLEPVRRGAEAGLGFELINRAITGGVQKAGESLRATQSGLLNWNVLGIVVAVVAVLAALAIGG